MYYLLQYFVLPVLAIIIIMKLLRVVQGGESRTEAMLNLKAWGLSVLIWVAVPLQSALSNAIASNPPAPAAAAAAVVAPAATAAVVKPAVIAAPAPAVVTQPAPAPAVAPAAVAAVAPATPVAAAVAAPAVAPTSSAVAPAAPVAAIPAAPAPEKVVTARVAQTTPARSQQSREDAERRKSEAELDALNSKLGELLRK